MSADQDKRKREVKKRPTLPQGPSGECCEKCRFYLAEEGQEYNDCRESSLQIINHGFHFQNSNGTADGASFKHSSSWPRSHRFEWCGKFVKRD